MFFLKQKKLLIVIAAMLFVAVAAVSTALVTQLDTAADEPYTGEYVAPDDTTSTQTFSDITESFQPTVTTGTTADSATIAPSQSETSSTTLTESETTLTTAVSQVVTTVTTQGKKTLADRGYSLPPAPLYVVKDSEIDFDKTSLASYKYNPRGNYYYTDDKDCWQENFGFNEVYDTFAPLAVMYYDTVRVRFVYDNKSYMIQLWKGQYGSMFIGGEIGIYTQPASQTGFHYACADKDDWLKMEMTCFWDENNTGDHKAVFSRNYDDYWWMTGFVMGWLNDKKDRSEVKLVARITFEDEEMATAFEKAFVACGFKDIARFDVNAVDTYMREGNEVCFVWQEITQN